MEEEKVNFTLKQERFCQEYLKDFNATQSAIRAGFSRKTANQQGSRLLANVNIQKRIAEINIEAKNENIMTVQEIQERLTKMARGQIEEEIVVVEGCGLGESSARTMTKKVSAKDQAKALELLGKANGLFVDKVQNIEPPIIVDDIPEVNG